MRPNIQRLLWEARSWHFRFGPDFRRIAVSQQTTFGLATAHTQAYITDGLAANCGDAACTTFGTTVTGGGALGLGDAGRDRPWCHKRRRNRGAWNRPKSIGFIGFPKGDSGGLFRTPGRDVALATMDSANATVAALPADGSTRCCLLPHHPHTHRPHGRLRRLPACTATGESDCRMVVRRILTGCQTPGEAADES
jgi:hypothetical protein